MDAAMRNVEASIARGLPRLKTARQAFGAPATEWVSVVGFAPSLNTTWRGIRKPIFTTSGAHDFLVKRGVIPDYHVECDPRPHKALSLKTPHKDVAYLIASNCAPELFDVLSGFNVQIWHASEQTGLVEKWAKENDHETPVIGGGNNAGLRCMSVATKVLGALKYNLYGMDCSFDGGSQHAGQHFGRRMDVVHAKTCGKTYLSSTQMVSAAEYVVQMIDKHQIEVKVHGNGLLKTMVMEANRQLRAINDRKAA